MKPYTVAIEVDLPREQVVDLHLSGEPGQPGAKSQLDFLNGRHRIELVETITKRDLPAAFDATYEWAGGRNTLTNRFIELGAERTKRESTCTYRFSSPHHS